MSARPQRVANEPIYSDRALTARLLDERRISAGALTIGRADLEYIVARARRVGEASEAAFLAGVKSCLVCGCTQLAGCLTTNESGTWQPCGWGKHSEICTACEPYLAEVSR